MLKLHVSLPSEKAPQSDNSRCQSFCGHGGQAFQKGELFDIHVCLNFKFLFQSYIKVTKAANFDVMLFYVMTHFFVTNN